MHKFANRNLSILTLCSKFFATCATSSSMSQIESLSLSSNRHVRLDNLQVQVEGSKVSFDVEKITGHEQYGA